MPEQVTDYQRRIMKPALFLAMAALTSTLFGEEIMKVTLNGSLSEEKIASLSKIVFTDTKMIAGSTYDMASITKIEFYDNGISAINDQKPGSSSLKAGQIGIVHTGSHLNVTLPASQKMSVSLYGLNGRKIAELFNGTGITGTNAIALERSIAAGVYSVVVKADNVIYSTKISVK